MSYRERKQGEKECRSHSCAESVPEDLSSVCGREPASNNCRWNNLAHVQSTHYAATEATHCWGRFPSELLRLGPNCIQHIHTFHLNILFISFALLGVGHFAILFVEEAAKKHGYYISV